MPTFNWQQEAEHYGNVTGILNSYFFQWEVIFPNMLKTLTTSINTPNLQDESTYRKEMFLRLWQSITRFIWWSPLEFVGNILWETGCYHFHLDWLSIPQLDAWSNLKFYEVNACKIFSQKYWYLTEISVAFVLPDSGKKS